jgi:light-regulated signal transduction histidine kinase (bacteriophytochrome)
MPEDKGLPNQLEIDRSCRDADVEYFSQDIPRAISQTLEGVERVSRNVRAIKEFSHPGSQEKKSFDLNKAIESTITISRNERKYVAKTETQLDPDLSLVDPFFTTNAVGNVIGQGLMLAHTVIVKKHGGKIWFDSEIGKGTTFCLRLPLSAVGGD